MAEPGIGRIRVQTLILLRDQHAAAVQVSRRRVQVIFHREPERRFVTVLVAASFAEVTVRVVNRYSRRRRRPRQAHARRPKTRLAHSSLPVDSDSSLITMISEIAVRSCSVRAVSTRATVVIRDNKAAR